MSCLHGGGGAWLLVGGLLEDDDVGVFVVDVVLLGFLVARGGEGVDDVEASSYLVLVVDNLIVLAFARASTLLWPLST